MSRKLIYNKSNLCFESVSKPVMEKQKNGTLTH